MRTKLLMIASVLLCIVAAEVGARADQLLMQNGDRYFGKVVSVSTDTVVWASEILGTINVPRDKVLGLAFGASTNAPQFSTAAPTPPTRNSRAATNSAAEFPGALRSLAANTNLIRQIRDQMLGGNPEAAGKFDTMVNGLMSGKLTLDDIRREAKSSVDQLRSLQRELGPEADDSLDSYLDVLESFLEKMPAAADKKSPAPNPVK